MKLNTKNIFESSSLKTTPKMKIKKPHHTPKLSSPFRKTNKQNKQTKNKANGTSNLKKKILSNSNINVNPFELSELSHDLKCMKLSKTANFQKSKSKAKNDVKIKENFFEDSYNNNIALTNGSDNNDNVKIKNIKTDEYNNRKQLDFEQLYSAFQKSDLKSTIIVDNNGNNNLDLEQKRIIDDYFNKKDNNNNNKKGILKKNRYTKIIRKIPTQIYMDNKSFFKRINHLKTSNIDTSDKTNSIIKKCQNNKVNKNLNNNHVKFQNNNCLKIKENILEDKFSLKNKKMCSAQINPHILIDDEKLIVENIILKEDNYEKNSIFEDDSNNSFNSSFLDSSFDEDFYKNLNN